jgi:hypothetical protein
MTTQKPAGRHGQLSLIETPRAWRLDERTRAVGRAGIAQARAALREGARSSTADAPRAARSKRAAA